ncbi:MAG: hypothetical protein Q9185_002955 [Variospora sp. 1 TL-2023]
MKSTFFSLAALAAVAVAAPAKNNLLALRQAAPEITDGDILNYALTLEHLEDNFYRLVLDTFSESDFAAAGYDSAFYDNLQEISSDERTHVSYLTAALTAAGVTPVKECTYDFDIPNIKSFLVLSSMLEGVGVSAYLGAAADIMSKTYLTAAGSILTVEARHSAYLRSTLKQSPFPSPFDVPLTLNQVYTLAAPFIVSCPEDNPPLPVKAFPSLVSSPNNPEKITAGTIVTFLTEGYELQPASEKTEIYAAIITVTGPVFAEATRVEGGFSFRVPTAPEGTAEIAGQTYVVLTGCNTTVTDETTAAGPGLMEVTPQ